MNKCNEIVIVMNKLTTKKTNNITANATSTASIDCHSKKVKDCYILHSFIGDRITIDNYCYFLPLCKTKRYNIKWKVMNFRKFILKILHV